MSVMSAFSFPLLARPYDVALSNIFFAFYGPVSLLDVAFSTVFSKSMASFPFQAVRLASTNLTPFCLIS